MSGEGFVSAAVADESGDSTARRLALAAAAQAAEGGVEMLRFAREGANWPSAFGQEEPVGKFADAAKLAIETSMAAGDAQDDETVALYNALTDYLAGWAA